MDSRSLTEKLLAMAQQDASPAEAEIAQAKLQTMGAWPPPPKPPAATAAPAPEPGWQFTSTSSGYTSGATVAYTLNFWWSREPGSR